MNNELSLFILIIPPHSSQQHLFVIPSGLSAEASAKAEAKTGLAPRFILGVV
jgi:hypothetical protein